MDSFSTPPVFINEQGVKWWPDATVDAWIARKEHLSELHGFLVEEPSGRRTRLLLHKTQGILYDSTSMESILAKVDILAVSLELETREQQVALETSKPAGKQRVKRQK